MIKYKKIVEDSIIYKVETLPRGTKIWFLNNKCHRIGGPAIELGMLIKNGI
jgi:hypothetical protein